MDPLVFSNFEDETRRETGRKPKRFIRGSLQLEAERFCRASAVQLEVVYGGGSKQQQLAGLRKLPSVLVATPGRLLEFLEALISGRFWALKRKEQ